MSKIEEYNDVIRNILQRKSDTLKRKISELTTNSQNELELKIQKLRSINIRVACFSEIQEYEDFRKKIQMWSHYADDHKGFCVEYDLSSLKKPTAFSIHDYECYDNQEFYLMKGFLLL